MQSRLLISVVACLLFLLTPSLWAAESQWPSKVGRWTAAANSRAANEAPSRQLEPALMKESGLITATHRTYAQGDKKAYCTLYTFHDSSGAYEVFTALRVHISKGDQEEFGRTIYKSNQVLDVVSDSKFGEDAEKDAARWLQSISDGVASPPIASYLPSQGRVPGTDFYTLGPEGFRWATQWNAREAAGLVDKAGFNSGAEAMFAEYQAGKEEATLLLIEYPTPQLAELHLKHMQREILAAKNGASVERKGSLLSIVLAPTSEKYAAQLRSSVNYETQVTWSEPSSTATDPPIISTLVKIFVATIVFMVVTVVVGIAFGGVRIITKRLFPGKVFDRPEHLEVLQLGLTGKPIDPRDLY
jgi:hypothetical protein